MHVKTDGSIAEGEASRTQRHLQIARNEGKTKLPVAFLQHECQKTYKTCTRLPRPGGQCGHWNQHWASIAEIIIRLIDCKHQKSIWRIAPERSNYTVQHHRLSAIIRKDSQTRYQIRLCQRCCTKSPLNKTDHVHHGHSNMNKLCNILSTRERMHNNCRPEW